MITDIDQVSKWHLARWTKFTSSENHKLVPKGQSESKFEQSRATYIDKKVTEKETNLWENPKLEFVENLLWGRRYEEPAFDEYVQHTRNNSIQYFGTTNPLFISFDMDSGGSPDAIDYIGERKADIGAEIKCPADPNVHRKYRLLTNQQELRAFRPEYYCQIQDLMRITQAPLWHFVSFDERFREKNMRIKILEIKPDGKYQENLEIRIVNAVKERDRLVEIDRNLKN